MDNLYERDDEQFNESGNENNKYEKPKKKKKGLWILFTGLLAILSKLKFLLVILKFSKFASTFISMFLMIFIYAQMYGWSFGIGFVLLLFVHEMGHYLTAKYLNLDVSVPIFIPFVGALINMKEQPNNAVTEAKMAIGGPILGSIGAFACFISYYIFNQDFLLALAYVGFMLNLFNLIPLHPLDGGRTVSAISPKLWLIGIPVGVVAIFKFFNPILILILILGVIQFINQWKNPDKAYYDVPIKTRILFALIYFGLMTMLGIGMTYIHSVNVNMVIS